jgi:hypothetical protein
MNVVGFSNRSYSGHQSIFLEDPIEEIIKLPIDIIQFIKNLYQPNIRYLKNNVESTDNEAAIEYPTTSRIESLSFLSGIIYPNPEELRLFIRENFMFLNIILYASKVTSEYFKESSQLSLEVEHDPESGRPTLYLFIRKNNYTEDIQGKIKEIRKIYRNSGYIDSIDFVVTTDYQPPLST